MKAKLDKDGLDCRPHRFAQNYWYYEEKSGLRIYFANVGNIGTISWRSIRASLKRYDAAKARKAAK